jgi:hypothetical protein
MHLAGEVGAGQRGLLGKRLALASSAEQKHKDQRERPAETGPAERNALLR